MPEVPLLFWGGGGILHPLENHQDSADDVDSVCVCVFLCIGSQNAHKANHLGGGGGKDINKEETGTLRSKFGIQDLFGRAHP